MVLDIARRQIALFLAFEFLEQHRRGLAQGIDQHVEAATVGHANHNLINAKRTAATDGFIHGNDQRLAAFERETLLPDILGVQVALQGFGSGQTFENAFFLFAVEGRPRADAFQLVLQPALLIVIRHVHVLDTDGAAIRLAQGFQNFRQLRIFRQSLERTDIEHLLQIGIGKPVERGLQLIELGTRQTLERIEVGPAGAQRAVSGHHLAHRRLLFVFSTCNWCDGRAESAITRQFCKRRNHRRMGHVACDKTRHLGQAVKIITPLGGN